MLSRLSSAAFSGTRIKRNSSVSRRNDSRITVPMKNGSRLADLVAHVGEIGRQAPHVGVRRTPIQDGWEHAVRRRSMLMT